MPRHTKGSFLYMVQEKAEATNTHQKSVLVFGEEACMMSCQVGPFALYELYLIKKVIFQMAINYNS